MAETAVVRLEKDARKSGSYMPTLDGWRAIAIFSVMVYHESLHHIWGIGTGWFYANGETGVDVFFAISGILICSRLLAEEQRFGSISLPQFYVRRAFRILPPAMLYLCVLALLSALSIIPHVGRDWFGALFFFRNYTRLLGTHLVFGGWFTDHFWSLSVEEHFYLLLPAILVLTRRKHRLKVLSALIVLVAISLAVQLRYRPWTYILFHSDVRLDSLFIPALVAVLIQRDALRIWFRRAGQFWPLTLVAVFALITWTPENFGHVFGLALLMPVLVLGTVLNPGTILSRFLEMSPLRFIGRISYSLYLWQQLFFTSHFHADASTLGGLQHWPLNYLATFICALASYHLLEKPAMHFGHGIAARLRR